MTPAAAAAHAIPARFDTVFQHEYPVDHPDLRRLYENAKRDQWNVSKDIDWTRSVDLDEGVLADELIDIYGTPYWDRLSKKDRAELNRRFTAFRMSLLLHGEHGAMLVCSQLVETVQGTDAKFFQATQVVDEARHNEVLNRYMAEKLDGLYYPLAGNVRELFDTLLGDSRWTVKTIGLQLVAETFAVALFKMLGETAKDTLFRDICRLILQDESRHMGFGMLSLPAVIAGLSEKERIELEDFTHWALVRTLTGLFPEQVYRDMGFSTAEVKEIQTMRRVRAGGNDNILFRTTFKRDLHTSLLQNLQRVGLLTDRIAPKLEALGIKVPTARVAAAS
ncbi:MAG TPA: ferritin-like domain-containing protein [Candidatus Bathyarchaeia archaeon]|nr:ferritin-like domain-containing protein [Candidatus Bathyarchaeia archaeon]